MGTVHAKIKLENPKRANLKAIETNALVDTGSLFLCLPEEVRLQLQLEESSKKEITTADGKRCLCPYVGPVRVQFENRECYVGAVVLGDEVLLGAVPSFLQFANWLPIRFIRISPPARQNNFSPRNFIFT
jgi:clan AA aspartic protease